MKLVNIHTRINAILDHMNDIIKTNRQDVYDKDLKSLLNEYKVLKSYIDLNLRKNNSEQLRYLLPRIPEQDIYEETKYSGRPQTLHLLSSQEFFDLKNFILQNL